jgi:methyl-accepting chemotaxis protein
LEHTQAQQASVEEDVRQILEAMQRFAFGDLTVRIDGGRRDEIGKIFTGFNKSVESVEQLVQRVIENVRETNSIANHISSASEQVATMSRDQSSQIMQIAAAVEATAQSVSSNAQHAVRMDALTRQTGQNAVLGAEVVRSAVTKIREIARVVSTASEVVETLGNSSAEIDEIVQVIEEIADQTNLLALNAAIEAARAGDQGRGFAVVADEVRKLAERTAQATKQISHTIQQIQTDTNRAVSGMKSGDAEVRLGLTLAQQAGEALDKIVGGTREVELMVKTSAEAMESQSESAEKVAQRIEQMSVSVEEATTNLNEVAHSTEHLTGLTHDLEQLVEQFTVSKAAHSSSNPRVNGGSARQLR